MKKKCKKKIKILRFSFLIIIFNIIKIKCQVKIIFLFLDNFVKSITLIAIPLPINNEDIDKEKTDEEKNRGK